ncbi:MAG: hypothetical protein LBH86_05250 [Oscillospiraceae bacterium]|nr:hypothetical protein [Oscillospiraceae bacterium]
MALNTLIHVSQDERERAINRSRRMWQTDMESNLNTSHEAGRIEGRAEGRQEGMRLGEEKGRRVGMSLGEKKGRREGMRLGEERGRRDIVQRMRAKGMDNAAIADLTGYPVEEIQQYN